MKQLIVNAAALYSHIGRGFVDLCCFLSKWLIACVFWGGLAWLVVLGFQAMTLTGAVLILALVVLCSGGRR